MLKEIIMGYEQGDRTVIMYETRFKGKNGLELVKEGRKPYVVEHSAAKGGIHDRFEFASLIEAVHMFNKYKDFIIFTAGKGNA